MYPSWGNFGGPPAQNYGGSGPRGFEAPSSLSTHFTHFLLFMDHYFNFKVAKMIHTFLKCAVRPHSHTEVIFLSLSDFKCQMRRSETFLQNKNLCSAQISELKAKQLLFVSQYQLWPRGSAVPSSGSSVDSLLPLASSSSRVFV